MVNGEIITSEDDVISIQSDTSIPTGHAYSLTSVQSEASDSSDFQDLKRLARDDTSVTPKFPDDDFGFETREFQQNFGSSDLAQSNNALYRNTDPFGLVTSHGPQSMDRVHTTTDQQQQLAPHSGGDENDDSTSGDTLFRRQLEALRQKLQLLAIKHQEEVTRTKQRLSQQQGACAGSRKPDTGSGAELHRINRTLDSILSELKYIQARLGRDVKVGVGGGGFMRLCVILIVYV